MHGPRINLEFQYASTGIAYEHYERLIRKLFFEQEGVEQVTLSELPGGHIGLSSMAILLARPTGTGGSGQNPLLLRVGPRAAIEEENRRYNMYVQPAIGGNNFAQLRKFVIDDTTNLGLIAYNYLSLPKDGQALRTLRDFFTHDGDSDAVNRAVVQLFQETLTQGGRLDNGWYNGRLHPQQRPLWFYNTLLPPTLVLDQVELTDKSPEPNLAALLSIADRLIEQRLIEQTIVIGTGGPYSHLEIVERESDGRRLRLYLYEQAPQPASYAGVFQALPQVAARIDLLVNDEFTRKLLQRAGRTANGGFRLPIPIHGAIAGKIVATRSTLLQARVDLLRRGSVTLRADGWIVHDDEQLPNPLLRYHELLSRPRPLTCSIVHGDMNLGNILLSWSKDNTATPFLIDFDKTGPGQHAVFDAVKLETEYKVHILPHRLRSLDNFTRLERALFQAMNNPKAELQQIKGNHYLEEAYRFLATVRRAVLVELNQPISPVEYYLGLLGYGLAALKYDNLYSDEKNRWLTSTSHIRPLAMAAYLSASYAVAKIEDAERLHRSSDWLPPVPLSRQTRIKTERLIGRDKILVSARRQLVAGQPVVLCGALGSGRHSIAYQLLAELEREGYTIWPRLEATFNDIQELAKSLVFELQRQAERDQHKQGASSTSLTVELAMYVRALDQAKDPLGGDTYTTHLEQMRNRLHNLLEGSARPFALLLDLDRQSVTIRSFLLDLAATLRRTAVVIITATSLKEEPFIAGEHQVPLFTEQQVLDYIADRQLPLDSQAAHRLFEESQGMPSLVAYLIDEGYNRLALAKGPSSLQECVLLVTQERPHIFKRLPEPLKLLFGLDGLVRELPGRIDNIPQLLADLVERASDGRLDGGKGWVDLYYEHALHNYRALAERHREQALAVLPTEIRCKCYERLADIFHVRGVRDPKSFLLEAVCRVLLHKAEARGEKQHPWNERHLEQTATALLQLVDAPQVVFSEHCELICDLLELVLQPALKHNVARLRQLYGDSLAYLGRFTEAAHEYATAEKRLASGDQAEKRLLARWLRACEKGNRSRLKEVADKLRRLTGPADPYHALSFTSADQPDSEQLAQYLEHPITILEQSQSNWGDNTRFFTEELVRLRDEQAVALNRSGKSEEAIARLRRVNSEIDEGLLHVRVALHARVENNLACFYYYGRCGPGDSADARQLFEEALAKRVAVGDRRGAMITAFNLCNVEVNLATGAEDWGRAEARFGKYLKEMERVQAADAPLIIANFMDLLTNSGRFEQARALFDQVKLDDVDSYTRRVLLINRTRLALREGDVGRCQSLMAEVTPALIADLDAEPIDWLEWVQVVAECRLRFPDPPGGWKGSEAIERLSTIPIDDRLRRRDAAEWYLADGLVALAQQAFEQAGRSFERSREIWWQVGFIYRAADTMVWQVRAMLGDGNRARAGEYGTEAEKLLAPFGEIPSVQHLRDLRRHIDTGADNDGV